MLHKDFLHSAFVRVVPHPFHETRLMSKETAERLSLKAGDESSLVKFRVSAITMVLALSIRGVQESWIQRYQDDLRSSGELVLAISKSVSVFDAIVEQELGKAVGLPTYADAAYFHRWRFRFNAHIVAPDAGRLKPASVIAFLRQATFAYGEEPLVDATFNAILAQGEDVYDNYVVALRNEFGGQILL